MEKHVTTGDVLLPSNMSESRKEYDYSNSEVNKAVNERCPQDGSNTKSEECMGQSDSADRIDAVQENDPKQSSSEVDNQLLFTYKSAYFGESIDITINEKKRLMKGEMINDVIINFYLQYLLTTWIDNQLQNLNVDPSHSKNYTFQSMNEIMNDDDKMSSSIRSVLNRFYVFSTFFYPLVHRWQLKTKDDPTKIRIWSKYRLFEKEYLLIPIFSGSHWLLVAVCHLNLLYKYIKTNQTHYGINYSEGKKVTSKDTKAEAVVSTGEDSKQLKRSIQDQSPEPSSHCEELQISDVMKDFYPCIIVLDSIQESSSIVMKTIRQYLTFLLHEQDPSITTSINYLNLPCVTPKTTKQMNSVDCGLYLLIFAQLLINHYGEYNILTSLAHKQKRTNSVFPFFQLPEDAVEKMRSEILNVMDQLCKDSPEASSDSDSSEIECVFMKCQPKKEERETRTRRSTRRTKAKQTKQSTQSTTSTQIKQEANDKEKEQ